LPSAGFGLPDDSHLARSATRLPSASPLARNFGSTPASRLPAFMAESSVIAEAPNGVGGSPQTS
jgi:hypothetical protein